MNVIHNVDLTPYHTFGLPAQAEIFYRLMHLDELGDLIRLPECVQRGILWLGEGSNIIFADNPSEVVVQMATKGIQVANLSDGMHQVLVRVQAGELWHDFVQYAIEQGWYGLENLSLIPGTVGAAPVQNIGAYGVEVKDYIDSVECFDCLTHAFVNLSRQQCQFAYRDSIFKQPQGKRYVITAVNFVLSTVFVPQISYGDLAKRCAMVSAEHDLTASIVSDVVCQIRREKLPNPKILGNSGSFFKNPIVPIKQAKCLQENYPNIPIYPYQDNYVKLAAAWLIEQCGLKGYAIGGAAVHTRQALVLVNQGNATAHDLACLVQYIINTVKKYFGIQLHIEPVWISQHK